MSDTIKTGLLWTTSKHTLGESIIVRENIDIESRTVKISFASERPVDRWFGAEILDHDPESIRLDRMRISGPLLLDHDQTKQIGIVEQVFIDPGSRKSNALVRFSKSALAEEAYQDVLDGIKRSTSVGYHIHRMVSEGDPEDKIFRATDWEPLEVSLVSVPADTEVGVGRTQGDDHETVVVRHQPKEERKDMAEERQEETKTAKFALAETPAPTIDVKVETERALGAERDRVSQIMALGKQWDRGDDAQEAIRNGATVDQFRKHLLDQIGQPPAVIFSQAPVKIDMTDKENRQYSVLNAIRIAAFGGDGIELDVSLEIARKLGRNTKGVYIPMTHRTMTAKVDSAGGYLVPDDEGALIELLRNRMMVRAMGATILSGLNGNVPFPRQSAATTAYWVGEAPGADVTASDMTFDQIVLSPRTVKVSTSYSRQLLVQSSPSIEAVTRDDLMTVNALAIDLAAINGSGVSGQPLGILGTTGIGSVAGGTNGLAPTWAHIVELETDVATANADLGRLGYLTNAAVRGKLKTVEKASNTGLFVWENGPTSGEGMLNGYVARVSNQVPSNLTKGSSSGVCSAIIFGNWADLLVAEWGVMEVITDPYSQKKQDLIEVTTSMFVDVALRHAASMSAMQDALTT